jgi:type I restriction enzyme S subunit
MPTPAGWRWVKLTEVATLETGHTPSREHPEYWDGDVPWIGIRDARQHHGRSIADTHQRVSQLGLENSAARLLPAGTVCLSGTASVGYVVVMGRPMATSQDFVNWICGPELDPKFLQWALVAEGDNLLSFGKGSTHTTIYFPEVLAFHLCLPPLDIQQRIVAKLDALLAQTRAAREQLEAVPTLVEKFRQSVLAAAFRGDLTADWRAKNPDVEPASKLLERLRAERRQRWEETEITKMTARGKAPRDDKWKSRYAEPEGPDTDDLPGLPSTWSWATIEQLCPPDAPAVYGIILPGDHVEEGVPYVRPVDVAADGMVDVSQLKRTSTEIAKQYERAMLRAGDVVLSIVGTIGKVMVVPPELDGGNITQSSIRIRPPAGVATAYVKLLLLSPLLRGQYDRYRFGNAVQRLNVEHVRRLVVPVAPQREAAELVRLVEGHLARAGELEAASVAGPLGTLETALLAKAFRGELT